MAPRSNDFGRATTFSSELAADFFAAACSDGLAGFLLGALPFCAAAAAPRTIQSKALLQSIVLPLSGILKTGKFKPIYSSCKQHDLAVASQNEGLSLPSVPLWFKRCCFG